MSDYSIVIATSPRPGEVIYLDRTIQSLTRGGVFISPLLKCFAVCPSKNLSIQENMIHCLQEASRMGTEWSIIMADDVLVCGKFLQSVDQWLQDCAAPQIPFYPLGANYESVEHPQVAWRYLMQDFYGAQCLCIHRSRIQSLIDRLQVSPLIALPDMQIKEWGNAIGAFYVLTPCPSFVQHIGEVSTQPHSFYNFPSWPGEHWDYVSRSCTFSPKDQCNREHYTSDNLKHVMTSHFDPLHPVYDFGCSSGLYLQHLKDMNFEVMGLEGTPGISEITGRNFIVEFNLLNPVLLDPPGQVVCLEVMEHIPEEYEGVLVESLIASCNGLLVISWAIPGQGGSRHVNERPREYVLEVFRAYGYILNEILTSLFREQGGEDLKWFLNSIYVFEKPTTP